jgi:hypothetical protein
MASTTYQVNPIFPFFLKGGDELQVMGMRHPLHGQLVRFACLKSKLWMKHSKRRGLFNASASNKAEAD